MENYRINESINGVKQVASNLYESAKNIAPPTILMLSIPGVLGQNNSFNNGTFWTLPEFIWGTSGAAAGALVFTVVSLSCFYKYCTKPTEPAKTWSLPEETLEDESQEDEAARLLFFSPEEQDSSSIILSTQVTPQGSMHGPDDERKEYLGEEFDEWLIKWKIADYVGAKDSPFATDDDSTTVSTTNRFDIQDAPEDSRANG